MLTSRRRRIRTAVGAGLVGLVLVLSGCGPDHQQAGDGAASRHSFNQQDVSFAREMIPRQRQASYMGRLAESRTNNPVVLMLASRIQGSQVRWTDGMMTGADVTGLAAAFGPAFDRMFLDMMVRHHEATLGLAEAESIKGLDPATRNLARRVRVVQQRELEQMQQLIAENPRP